jgi:hypothetical protein
MAIDAPIPATPPIPNVFPGASATAVIAPAPADRWQALRQVGWWKPVDTFVLGALGAHLITGFFFLVFGKMSFAVGVIGLLQMILLMTAWCVSLAYRCMDFVLQLRANIEMLPFDSARIAVGFLQGGQPLNTPVPR